MTICRQALVVGAIVLTPSLTACHTISGAMYQPVPATSQHVDLASAITDASYAVVNGKGSYVTYASAFSSATFHEVNFTQFIISSDGKTATAVCQCSGATTKVTHTISDWISPGIAYANGVIAFRNNTAGPVTGDRYELDINWGLDPEGLVSIYWRNFNAARKYADSMVAIHDAAGAQFAEKFFSTAFLPDDYPPASPSLPFSQSMVQESAEARSAALGGQTDQAIALYGSALAANSRWPAGHYNLAILYLLEGHYENATNEMNTYLALAPDAPNVAESERLVSEWQFLDEAAHK